MILGGQFAMPGQNRMLAIAWFCILAKGTAPRWMSPVFISFGATPRRQYWTIPNGKSRNTAHRPHGPERSLNACDALAGIRRGYARCVSLSVNPRKQRNRQRGRPAIPYGTTWSSQKHAVRRRLMYELGQVTRSFAPAVILRAGHVSGTPWVPRTDIVRAWNPARDLPYTNWAALEIDRNIPVCRITGRDI